MIRFLPALFLLACDGGKDTADTETTVDTDGEQAVTLTFDARFGSQPAACGQAADGVGTSGSSVELQDLRFFVHGVELVTADGDAVAVSVEDDGAWQSGGVALLDFEDATGKCANGSSQLNSAVTGTVPAGEYTGVRFVLGVPAELNHEDPTVAPSPLNLTAMHWSWQGGYKFMRMDLSTEGLPEGWFFHLGSTGCEADESGTITGCASPNRVDVELEMDPDSQVVVVDFAALLAGSDVDTDSGGAQGCMSGPDDPECPPLLDRVGVSGAQALFSAE